MRLPSRLGAEIAPLLVVTGQKCSSTFYTTIPKLKPISHSIGTNTQHTLRKMEYLGSFGAKPSDFQKGQQLIKFPAHYAGR